MSLATRCPACQTVFRVVQDQLRVSEGWVRCGRCAEVFNALEHMVEVVRPPTPAAPVVAPPLPPPEVPAGTPDLSDPEARHDARGWGAPEPAPAPAPQESDVYDPLRHGGPDAAPDAAAAGMAGDEPPAAPAGADVLDELPAHAFDPQRPADGPDDGPLAHEALLDVRPGWRDEPVTVDDWAARAMPGAGDDGATSRAATTEAATAPAAPAALALAAASTPAAVAAADAADAADAPAPLPSFVRRAERAERWQRPGVRRALLGLVLLGLLALGLQVLVTYRDIAAARWPVARAALEPLCRALGCRIEPPRWLDAVVVDSTGLSLIEGTGTYRLQVVLRNRSTLALAPPSLDVSLKDAQGRLLVRRQLALRELGSAVAVLPAASDVTLQATLSLSGPAGEKTAVSSYTIEVFYP